MRTAHEGVGSMGRHSQFRGNYAHDIGYSSESHSNEETDLSASPPSEKGEPASHVDINTNLTSPTTLSMDYPDRRSKQQTATVLQVVAETQETVVLRKKQMTDITIPEGAPVSGIPPTSSQQTWRHSMTSAYDSNCSDMEKSTEAQGELSSGTELEATRKRFKYKQIINSPNQKFYTMTMVETDSESAERSKHTQYLSDASISQDQNTQNAAELSVDTDSSFLDFNESRDTITIANNSKTDIATDLDFRFSDLDSSQNEYSSKDETNTLHNQNGMVNGEDTEITNNSLPSSNHFESSEQYCQQVAIDNGAIHSELLNGKVNVTMGEVVSPPIASDSVRRLIRHAELMVMDEDLMRLQNAKWYQHRKTSKSKRSKSQSQPMMDSLTSTDGSLPTEEDTQISSCDASGEYTTGSESDGEYSTASSDEGDTGDSMVLSSQGSSPTSNSADIIVSTPKASSEPPTMPSSVHSEVVLRPKRVAKRRGERPWSVTELYELHNRLDLKPFSISESAINNKSSSMQNLSTTTKLRRTTSELSSLAIRRIDTPPRKSRRSSRKLKRSASESEQASSGSSPSLLNQSPIATPPRRYSTQERLERLAQSNTSSTDNKTVSCGEQSASSYHSDRSAAWTSSHSDRLVALNACHNDRSAARRLDMSDTAREMGRDASENDLDVKDKMYVLGRHDEMLGRHDSEDTDGVMNSTLESFSEQAWDNYQQSPYPSMSDDVPEEKLDDANLNWDNGLEFEDDFQISEQVSLSARKSSEKAARRSPEKCRPRDRRVSSSKQTHRYHEDASVLEDSDSDIEDLHHVITESCKSYAVVESALKKHHKDQMETGIDLDYSEYAELLATCETNIKCLQVINDTLDGEDGLTSVTDDDIQAVDDIIQQWEDLLELAIERHDQSRELSVIYKDMMTIKSTMHDVTEQLEMTFEDVKDLEDSIKCIQDYKLNVHSTMDQLNTMKKAVAEFANAHPAVDMVKCYESSANLHELVHSTDERCSSRMSELQLLMLSWFELNETRKELTYLLGQERRQLQCVDIMTGVMDFTYQDTQDTVSDLTAMQTDLAGYEQKLITLQHLSQDLQFVCEEKTGRDMQDSVAVVTNELTAIRAKCKEVKDKLETKINNMQVVETSVPVLNTEGATDVERLDEVDGSDRSSVAAAVLGVLRSEWFTPQRRHMFMRILKASLPVQVLLLLLLGGAYMLEPGCCDHMTGFGDYGFSLSPQLRYVNGPPPT